MPTVLKPRALNRATLARQMLLDRADVSAPDALTRLVGLQAQTPHSWYVGLWDRLTDFHPEPVSELLLEHTAIRMALMRGTLHLATAEDCLTIRPALQPFFDDFLQRNYGRQLVDVDREQLESRAREFVEEKPRTFAELRTALAPRWPDNDPQALAMAARAWLPLVQVTPRGLWGQSGGSLHTTAEAWIGRPLGPPMSEDELLRRYLAAFGPATVADAQTWCGLRTLGDAAERLRPELDVFEDERGRELFDLPDAPRPDPDTPAPVRFLYDYDNLLLSHADRSRFISEEDRKRAVAYMGNYVRGGVLVDGFGAALWRVDRTDAGDATLRIKPLQKLKKRETLELGEEAERLLDFVAGGAGDRRISIEEPV